MQLTRLLSFLPIGLIVRASPVPEDIYGRNPEPCPDYCAGTLFNATLEHTYICGDSRLGPVRLPTRLPLGDLVNTYDRFGGLCPGQFLERWYNSTSGSYNYPPDSGFQLDIAGAPIEGTITLPVGFLIDRFGSEYGSFASPEGTPYMQRALPPSNLDTPAGNPSYPYNYHVYKVLKPFKVLSGPIAAWFGQPGQGVQYELSTNIMGLVNGGFIERVTLNSF